MKKNKAQRSQTASAQTGARPAPVVRRSNLRFLLLLILFLAGSAAVSFVVFEYFVPKIPAELIGLWEVTNGDLRGATLEFRRDGTATATRNIRGKKEIDHYAVQVQGKKIRLLTNDQKTGKVDTVTQTIVELTENELVIRDENRGVYHMKRTGD